MSKPEILRVTDAERQFDDGHKALCGATLEIRPGEITALLGPSGSGKTTLLRAIAGLEVLDRGAIHFGETSWCETGHHLPPEIRRVGLVFQDYALFPHLNALDNVAFGLRRTDRKARALKQLEAAELAHKARNFPHELSGGEQQRVALARALAPEPAIILLDEPFSGLDRRLRADVRRRTLAAIRGTGAAALLVTHDAEEALESADRLALMSEGVIIQTGTPEHVWFNPVSATAARLVGDVNIAAAEVREGSVDSIFGPLSCDLDDGQTVDVLIRPEGLILAAGDMFEIIARDYAGAEIRLGLRGPDGSLWTARHRAADAPALGQRTGISLDTSFLRIIANPRQ